MANYIELTFPVTDTELQQVLIAQLSEEGFEGFEENETDLKAFIPETDYEIEKVQTIADAHQVTFSATLIESQNWNAVWESNFDPVVVDDFVAVRAGFHEPVAGVQLEIVITPKMSFGTGTGVLAILAEKRGAADVYAIDYDDWSIENATENCTNNQCSHVRLNLADNAADAGKSDIILANINKNVILDNLAHLKNALNEGGLVLLSGLLISDEADIINAAKPLSLQLVRKDVMNNWICLVME